MTLLCASVHREKNKKKKRERDKDLIKDNLVPACQATRDKLNASLPPSPAQLEGEGCPQLRVIHNSEWSLWFQQKVGNYLPGVKDLSNGNKEYSEKKA